MDISSISNVSMNYLARNADSQIGTALLKKALDNEETSSNKMMEQMRQAQRYAEPELGSRFDSMA